MANSEFKSAYETCLEVCGRLESPGLALDLPIWIDHTRDETTVDQARIEDALEKMDVQGASILHVGVGNSKFALRFGGRARVIDGLTVSPAEKKLADSIPVANYSVFLLNKYGREFLLTLKNRYDFVVDNNLASFACCKYHFYRMLDNYLWALNPLGRILTDQQGMDWVVEDPRWKLSFDDLQALEKKFPVSVSRVTETVYSIRKTEGLGA